MVTVTTNSASPSSVKLPDGTEVRARSTTIFVREDGEWRVVHSHASIGVPNEDALGEDVTRVD